MYTCLTHRVLPCFTSTEMQHSLGLLVWPPTVQVSIGEDMSELVESTAKSAYERVSAAHLHVRPAWPYTRSCRCQRSIQQAVLMPMLIANMAYLEQ